MASVLIAGYYGAKNLGDEAILSAMLRDLIGLQPDLEVTVISQDPDQTRYQHGVNAVCWNDLKGILEVVQEVDLIVVGGGGLFHDIWGLDPDYYLRRGMAGITTYGSMPLLAQIVQVPCMLYGVGIGPLKSDLAEEHTRLAAERCQLVTLRDQPSHRLLEKTGFDGQLGPRTSVHVLADPAFRLSMGKTAAQQARDILRARGINEKTPLLGVNLRYWAEPHPPEGWIPPLAQEIDDFLRRFDHHEVLIIPFQKKEGALHTDDRSVCRQLSTHLERGERAHLIDADLPPQAVQALIQHCSLFLGMRLHSLIMAGKTGVPVVGLPYDPKVKHGLDKFGLSQYCLQSFVPEHGQLSALLADAWENRIPIQNQLQDKGVFLEQDARRHAELAVQALTATPDGSRMGVLSCGMLFVIRLMEKIDLFRESLKKEKISRERLGRPLSVRVWDRMYTSLTRLNGLLSRLLWRVNVYRLHSR